MDYRKTASHFDLTGKVIVVTGGSRGLGFQMCKAFAEAGASIVVSSRKQDSCEEAAAAIRAETGAQCLAVACHVGDWDACDALVEASWNHFGRIDVLVNNAGMSPLYKSLSSVTRELWDKVIAVNLGGPFRLSAVVAEKMLAGEGGSIINVSSTIMLSVNGKPAGEGRVEKTIPARYGMDTFDVGMDLNAAVVRGGIYKTPYKFTGTIESVTVELKK